MTFRQPCPKCQYQRKPEDQAPDWQCPSCGVAYAKAMGTAQSTYHINRNATDIVPENSRQKILDRVLSVVVLLSFLTLLVSWRMSSRLPEQSEIIPEMLNEPIQLPTRKASFDFDYRKQRYLVEPVADYEIWGVVVTHNNITGMTDITHTEDSVDIKDLCVVWGDNVQTNDYRQVEYSSGDFTCFFSYKRPLEFHHNKLSNNHLLSNDKTVRDLIRQTRIGDQIRFKGMLVNYAPAENPKWMRRSSRTREDRGKRACEVVFVTDFEILKSTNARANSMLTLSLWFVPIAILIKLLSIAFPGLFLFKK